MSAGIPDMSQNRPSELSEKGVVAARRRFRTFEMDERKSVAISTAGVTTVVINTICNTDILVFDEGSRARDRQQQPGVGGAGRKHTTIAAATGFVINRGEDESKQDVHRLAAVRALGHLKLYMFY